MSEVKERPILFSAPMVRAILDGTKTMTRRVMKPQPQEQYKAAMRMPSTRIQIPQTAWEWKGDWWYEHPVQSTLDKCPYGKVGDRLWVRETWQEFFEDEITDGRYKGVRGEMGIPARPDRLSYVYFRADGEVEHPEHGAARWKSPMFLPRRASRILLEVKEVRVERVQSISNLDIKREGLPPYTTIGEMRLPVWITSQYQELWDSINAKRGYSWETDPFVWVVEFKRIEP